MRRTKPLLLSPCIVAALLVSVTLGSCSSSGSNDSDNTDQFNYDADLIAFRSERDGNLEIYLITTDGR